MLCTGPFSTYQVFHLPESSTAASDSHIVQHDKPFSGISHAPHVDGFVNSVLSKTVSLVASICIGRIAALPPLAIMVRFPTAHISRRLCSKGGAIPLGISPGNLPAQARDKALMCPSLVCIWMCRYGSYSHAAQRLSRVTEMLYGML